MNYLKVKAGSDFAVIMTPEDITKEECKKIIAYLTYLKEISK